MPSLQLSPGHYNISNGSGDDGEDKGHRDRYKGVIEVVAEEVVVVVAEVVVEEEENMAHIAEETTMRMET